MNNSFRGRFLDWTNFGDWLKERVQKNTPEAKFLYAAKQSGKNLTFTNKSTETIWWTVKTI
jgi:hypothetical protein